MGALSRLSGQVARDNNDVRAGGAKVFFFNGGTTTPLAVYQDAGQSIAHTHPVIADSNGRWPAIFIPFITSYDEQVTTSTGTELSYYTLIPNPDPVDVAAGAVTTSSTQLLQTGDVLFNPKSGTRTGFVRANGRTMGNAGSGGTERANNDTTDLFAYLWNGFSDALCAVSTGRGASAAADFAANKTITLFDLRGSSVIGLDDMGNAAASRLGGAGFTTGNPTTGGSTCGENAHVLSLGELATHGHTVTGVVTGLELAHTHAGTTDNTNIDHIHSVTGDTGFAQAIAGPGTMNHHHSKDAFAAGGGIGEGFIAFGTTNVGARDVTDTNIDHTHHINFSSAAAGGSHTHTFTSGAGSAHNHAVGGVVDNIGNSVAHNTVHRSLTGNWLIKL